MLTVLILWVLADPSCNTRKPGIDPDCITFEVRAQPPALTCKVACYTRTKRDGGLDSFVLHAEVPGADTASARASCQAQLQREANAGCRD